MYALGDTTRVACAVKLDLVISPACHFQRKRSASTASTSKLSWNSSPWRVRLLTGGAPDRTPPSGPLDCMLLLVFCCWVLFSAVLGLVFTCVTFGGISFLVALVFPVVLLF